MTALLPVALDQPPRVAERASRQFLPEIQVLRAIAVMLVVIYHYWPGTLKADTSASMLSSSSPVG